MTITKVLIDGGARLSIIFFDIVRKMGLEFSKMITPTSVPSYGIVPDEAAMPLRHTNYRTEFIKFQVVDFESSYHAIHG